MVVMKTSLSICSTNDSVRKVLITTRTAAGGRKYRAIEAILLGSSTPSIMCAMRQFTIVPVLSIHP